MARNGGPQNSAEREPFGQVAVRKGYVTQQDVTDALGRQKDIVTAGTPHKLIGMIMLEMGVLGTTELIEVLRDLSHPKDAGRVSP